MKIIIRSKNLQASQDLNSYIEEKLGTLKKYINILKREDDGKTLAEVIVEIEKETNHHRKGDIFCIKAQIQLPGKSLMAEAKSDDLFKAVVEARDELKMEIEKYKFKKIDKNRREQRQAKFEIEK